MKRVLFAILWVGCFSPIWSQGYHIEVIAENYSSDTLMLGYYYWDKQYIADTAIGQDGVFVFSGKEALPQGMYLIVTRPDNHFLQVLLDEDQTFALHLDYDNMEDPLKIVGSEENQRFQDYIAYLNQAKDRSQKIKEKYVEDPDSLMKNIEALDVEVRSYQDNIIHTFPHSLLALIIRSSREIQVPEFDLEGAPLKEMQYNYYVHHYFDHFDFSDPRLLYTSFLHSKIDRYLNKVLVGVPDSINQGLDIILQGLEPNPEAYKVVLIEYLNHYAASKYVGMDAVYVHLVDAYYARGKAPWVDSTHLVKMMDDASKLRPILVGKKAPEISLDNAEGRRFSLYDIDADYTILLFWAPDCGHCQKKMPALIEVYPQLKQRNAELIAVCTKLTDKEASCWEYLDQHDLKGGWINATDKYLRSRYKQKYNVTSTPLIYVLDKDKVIVSKKIGIEQLVDVIDNLNKIKSREGQLNN